MTDSSPVWGSWEGFLEEVTIVIQPPSLPLNRSLPCPMPGLVLDSRIGGEQATNPALEGPTSRRTHRET